MQKAREKFLLYIGLFGSVLAVGSVALFLNKILHNGLLFTPDIRQYYLAIGRSYTEGFVSGFGLCFSLVLVAIVVGRRFREARATPPQRPAGTVLGFSPGGASRQPVRCSGDPTGQPSQDRDE